MASEPMTLLEFENDAEDVLRYDTHPWETLAALRPLILRLLAGERARIIAALPGGDICDPQEIADMIRTMGDQT